MGGPVPACAARFGIVTFLWTRAHLRILHEFGKVPTRETVVALIRGPGEEKGAAGLVGEDLENSGMGARRGR